MSEVLLNWCHLIAQLWRIHYLEFDTDTVVTVCVGTKFWAQLDDVMCVLTVQLPAAALRGVESRGTAYAGMDLQPSAKDCIRLWYGGREGKKRTGVGGKLSETKRARIARRPPNRVSCEGRSEESLELSKLCLRLILQNQPGWTLEIWVGELTIFPQSS